MSCVVIGEDNEGMQRDYWYTLSLLAGLGSCGGRGQKGRRTHGQTVVATEGAYWQIPGYVSAEPRRRIDRSSQWRDRGGAQYRQASFLLGSLEQQVLPDWLSLQEDPVMAGGLASAYFDGDGVATRDNVFVENGRLKSYILSTYSARKLGMQTTGNAGECKSSSQGSNGSLRGANGSDGDRITHNRVDGARS